MRCTRRAPPLAFYSSATVGGPSFDAAQTKLEMRARNIVDGERIAAERAVEHAAPIAELDIASLHFMQNQCRPHTTTTTTTTTTTIMS